MPLMFPSSFSVIFVFVLGEAGAVIEPASQPASQLQRGSAAAAGEALRTAAALLRRSGSLPPPGRRISPRPGPNPLRSKIQLKLKQAELAAEADFSTESKVPKNPNQYCFYSRTSVLSDSTSRIYEKLLRKSD